MYMMMLFKIMHLNCCCIILNIWISKCSSVDSDMELVGFPDHYGNQKGLFLFNSGQRKDASCM